LIIWQGGKPLTSDITVVYWQLHICRLLLVLPALQQTSLPVLRKEAKYTGLTDSYIFQPIAVEIHGIFSSSALSFLNTLDERLTATSDDLRGT